MRSSASFLLAIDQGTTNSRAIIFNRTGEMVSQYELPLNHFYPADGWVEQDAVEMFTNTISCCNAALQAINLKISDIAAIGIANQRETTIIWDRISGAPIYHAIVWQDRRTSDLCEQLKKTDVGQTISEKTGLLLDPYFSATKIMWLLDHIPGARQKAENGELLFGTVDSFLLWKLTDGNSHLTDATNASRTLLYNIHTQSWDREILSALNIPMSLLPEVRDNSSFFGESAPRILGASLPILAMAGDQQAATFGQACFQPGMVKATLGTGCFLLLNTGSEVIQSTNRLIATIAYRLPNTLAYGVEGSIFSAGLTVKWLRDSLRVINAAAETETLAKSIADNAGTYLVPAFTGLGAPYWDPHARGAILGMTRNTNIAHLARAALESVAYQTRDLLEAIIKDSHAPIESLRVDGGMVANDWFLQFLADMLNVEVQRPVCIETTALGVAYLAGLQAGIYQSLEEISNLWRLERRFVPQMPVQERERFYGEWKQAVSRVLTQ